MVALPAALETTSTASPFFQTFLAAQVASGARGFLSKSITVAAMHQQSGDIHHIVPKDYLQKNGFPDRGDYNQVANFALTETSINISIGNKPPAEYMAEVIAQGESEPLVLGEIADAWISSGTWRERCAAEPRNSQCGFLSGVPRSTTKADRRSYSELFRPTVNRAGWQIEHGPQGAWFSIDETGPLKSIALSEYRVRQTALDPLHKLNSDGGYSAWEWTVPSCLHGPSSRGMTARFGSPNRTSWQPCGRSLTPAEWEVEDHPRDLGRSSPVAMGSCRRPRSRSCRPGDKCISK